MNSLNQRTLIVLFLSAIVAYGFGLFIGIMNIDAAQYAEISREMLETKSFLVVNLHFQHYLDKPPLLFWLSALSYQVFGYSDFSYRLPSFLFSILALLSTYKLADLFYTKRIALYALIIITCNQAYFLFNHDVRTDTILAGSVIFSIWQLFLYIRSSKILPFVLGFLGIACAMLTKGPIGVMVPALALGMHFLLKKEWGNIFKWQWLLGLVLVFILLIPMMWGLYQQAFAFPNEKCYADNKFYGLRFFYWIQSFGRITGENTWHNKHDPFFFVHSFLWSFMPWALISMLGFWRIISNLFKKQYYKASNAEFFTFGGIVLPFLAFSTSKYVLPHYIFVFYPLVAIVTAKTIAIALEDEKTKFFKAIFTLQVIANSVIGIIALLIITFIFPTYNPTIWACFLIGLGGTIWFMNKKNSKELRLIGPSAFAIVMMNILMNSYFYPTLLTYQGDLQVGKFANEHHIAKDKIFVFGPEMCFYSFEFKTGNLNAELSENQLNEYVKKDGNWLYTDKDGFEKVKALKITPKSIRPFKNYPVTKLTGKFLNPKKRDKVVKTTFLLEF